MEFKRKLPEYKIAVEKKSMWVAVKDKFWAPDAAKLVWENQSGTDKGSKIKAYKNSPTLRLIFLLNMM